jgi:GNAT superfamily N-acetyltransferase
MHMTWHALDAQSPAHAAAIASIWNAACGVALSITPRFAAYNLRATTGLTQAGKLLLNAGTPVAFVIASIATPNEAWLDAIAVHPQFQRRGYGRALLRWAVEWLRDSGAQRVVLGGSLRPFVPGAPVETDSARFFRAQGWAGDAIDADLSCDLASELLVHPGATNVSVTPVSVEDVPALREFLARSFPGRWRFECDEHFREGGRPEDYIALWADDSGMQRVEGFCQITLEDSLRPLDRFYPHGLPRPWGQLGSIGVSSECRGKGYAAAMINGALAFLKARGVRGCVIDWTELISFYERFGFKVSREYVMMRLALA